MRKLFSRFLVIVIMIAISSLMLSNNKEITANNSSPPAQRKIAVEMNARQVFTTYVLSFEKWQIPLTVTEELAVKKCDANFGIITMLPQPTNSVMQLVSNKLMPTPIATIVFMRDGQGCHILKELIKEDALCITNPSLLLSQYPVMEGLRINEKVAIYYANVTG